MPEYRAIRIHMPDRPGALSAISSALAAHQVDIVRLDVVSHEGETVVDDLILSAATQEDIGRAVGSFYPEVTVRTFEHISGDPALEMGDTLRAIAAARDLAEARSALLRGAGRLARADDVVLLRSSDHGALLPIASTLTVPALEAQQAFAGRWVLERRTAAAFPVADGWAPQSFQHALASAWVAIAPSGGLDLLLTSRRLNIPFYSGELERLATFAEAANAILTAAGDRPPFSALPAAPAGALPARAVTVAKRTTVA